jgi:hypothetical protein
VGDLELPPLAQGDPERGAQGKPRGGTPTRAPRGKPPALGKGKGKPGGSPARQAPPPLGAGP